MAPGPAPACLPLWAAVFNFRREGYYLSFSYFFLNFTPMGCLGSLCITFPRSSQNISRPLDPPCALSLLVTISLLRTEK